MTNNSKIWIPKIGDLVAIPELRAIPAGVRQNSSYGIVISCSSHLERSAIFFEGGIHWLDNVILMPLWSISGTWLQLGKLET